jgi:hypothetical protein
VKLGNEWLVELQHVSPDVYESELVGRGLVHAKMSKDDSGQALQRGDVAVVAAMLKGCENIKDGLNQHVQVDLPAMFTTTNNFLDLLYLDACRAIEDALNKPNSTLQLCRSIGIVMHSASSIPCSVWASCI